MKTVHTASQYRLSQQTLVDCNTQWSLAVSCIHKQQLLHLVLSTDSDCLSGRGSVLNFWFLHVERFLWNYEMDCSEWYLSWKYALSPIVGVCSSPEVHSTTHILSGTKVCSAMILCKAPECEQNGRRLQGAMHGRLKIQDQTIFSYVEYELIHLKTNSYQAVCVLMQRTNAYE